MWIELLTASSAKLSQRNDIQAGEIFDLNRRMERMEKTNSDLAAEVAHLRDANKHLMTRNNQLSQQVDDLEQYSRSSNILVHGLLPANPGPEQNLSQHVLDVLNNSLQLSPALTASDVSAVHRVPRPSTSTTGTTGANRPSPVIIQFPSRSVRARVLTQRKLIKGNASPLPSS